MQSEQAPVPQQPDEPARRLAGDALQRRRMLLRGVGKGAAVAAVVVPIQSLATGGTMNPALCTVSGLQSNVGSARVLQGGTTDTCSGFQPGHFETLANWPGYSPGVNGGAPSATFLGFNEQAWFSLIFRGGPDTPLVQILQPGPDSSEKVWAAALLTAVKKGPNAGSGAMTTPGYFPYTPSEVLSLYADVGRRAAAETLFATISLEP